MDVIFCRARFSVPSFEPIQADTHARPLMCPISGFPVKTLSVVVGLVAVS